MHGFGHFNSKNFSFSGQFKKGIWHGYGIACVGDKKLKGLWKYGIMTYAMFDSFERSAAVL